MDDIANLFEPNTWRIFLHEQISAYAWIVVTIYITVSL